MAIISASYLANEQVGDTTFRVKVRLVTNDARGTFDQWFEGSGTTLAQLRDNISKQIEALNTKQTAKSVLDAIAVGAAIPISVAAPAATTPTAKEVWQSKARSASVGSQINGLSGAAATALAALVAEVNSTYAAGFWDGF